MSRFWEGRRVLVTGHTGFKGSWLVLMLARCGARVHGYALQPPTKPSLFETARVHEHLSGHAIGDVRDARALADAVEAAAPEVVFHLAAQPLVRASYREPVETYATNVMGTVHLLEAARSAGCVRALVNVTSDKCYAEDASGRPHHEGDALGGHDPYASSKACAELVTSAYRDSFLASQGVLVASARAGNVIGGGDWAQDRLVPDFFRALDAGEVLEVRRPDAVRPWQHVLDPLSGYLQLAERLASGDATCARPWNFGPAAADARPVRWLLERLSSDAGAAAWRRAPGRHPHETATLLLDSTEARRELGWKPRWPLQEALARTLAWHRAWRAGADMQRLTLDQIAAHAAREPVAA